MVKNKKSSIYYNFNITTHQGLQPSQFKLLEALYTTAKRLLEIIFILYLTWLDSVECTFLG